jgi:hypothetical protein
LETHQTIYCEAEGLKMVCYEAQGLKNRMLEVLLQLVATVGRVDEASGFFLVLLMFVPGYLGLL